MTKKYKYVLDLNSNNASAKVANLVGRNKSVLEVGCASGSQSKKLKDTFNCIVTGIEIDADSAKEAQSYCENVIVGDIESINLEQFLGDKKFDVITFTDVLEHLRNPVAALQKIKPYIADSGYLLASIPNIAHASITFELIKGNFDYREQGLLDDSHIRFFTKRSVLQLFEKAGYIVANLDRVIDNPGDTEFQTTPIGEEEKQILDYILARNPESRTYQFIITAFKATEGTKPLDLAGLMTQERIRNLEQQLKEKQDLINRLESNLSWIQKKYTFKIFSMIRKAINPKH